MELATLIIRAQITQISRGVTINGDPSGILYDRIAYMIDGVEQAIVYEH